MGELSNREIFIKEKFNLSEEVVSKITKIGNELNTNKYNVWIAKEAKKEPYIINEFQNISNIINWAKHNKIDIMKLSFEEAKEKQKEWQKEKISYKKIQERIDSNEIELNRVIFISSDGNYFFYLLKTSDLEYEGTNMEHCVFSESSYAEKIKKNKILIISLRDESNIPHATLEIDAEKGKSLQVRGKKNQELSKKLNKILIEFILYVSGFSETENNEMLKLINSNLKFF